MAAGTVQVRGYRELMRAFAQADRDSRKYTRAAFKQVGDIVRRDAIIRFTPIDAHSAAGYRTRVRQRGIAVEQSLRKTTGNHPEYGSLQMRRGLLPALLSNADEAERAFEQALDRMCDHFNHGGRL